MASKKKNPDTSEDTVESVTEASMDTAEKRDEATAPDAIEDAEIVEETAPESSAIEDSEAAGPSDETGEEDAGGAEPFDAEPEMSEDDLPEPEETASAEPEPTGDDFEPEEDVSSIPHYESTAAPEPLPVAPPQIVRKGGFVPMILGGIVAALIGFAAARYVLPEGWPWPGASDDALRSELTARLDDQGKEITALGEQLKAEAAQIPDLSPVTARLDDVEAALASLTATLATSADRLAALDARLTELEKRPVTESVSPEAVAAYERELKALQAAMAAQRAEVEKIAAKAVQTREEAQATARETMIRAAVSQIRTALDAGTGFAEAAATLSENGVALPPLLTEVADEGIATRAELAESFPAAARAALAVARKTEDKGGLGAFLKNQFGARSLEPRDGTDADAVLSRAEAAVREGRLGDALAEIKTLPEPARAEMSDWLAQATQRRDALAAAETLAAETN